MDKNHIECCKACLEASEEGSNCCRTGEADWQSKLENCIARCKQCISACEVHLQKCEDSDCRKACEECIKACHENIASCEKCCTEGSAGKEESRDLFVACGKSCDRCSDACNSCIENACDKN